jgi:hypothetical protein
VDRIAKAKVDIVTLYNCDVVQLLGQAWSSQRMASKANRTEVKKWVY